jgi:(1->4)-alpha-D-glucan 1-alpha-D-glucosylmutase
VLFERGRYAALPVLGAHAAHICAFARIHEGVAVLTIVPRLLLDLTVRATRPPLGGEVWSDTRVMLPASLPAAYHDVLTGALRAGPATTRPALLVGELFETLPVSLLESASLPATRKRSARDAGTRRASIRR